MRSTDASHTNSNRRETADHQNPAVVKNALAGVQKWSRLNYSLRSASIGLSMAARRAGKNPNRMPVMPAAAIATITA